MGDIGSTYSLKFTSRALAALSADKINSKWVVGTNALREDNEVRNHVHQPAILACPAPALCLLTRAPACVQIRVLQYDPDQERLLSVRSFQHTPEIWCIAPSGASEDLFLTVWSRGTVPGLQCHAPLTISMPAGTQSRTGARASNWMVARRAVSFHVALPWHVAMLQVAHMERACGEYSQMEPSHSKRTCQGT